MIAGRTSRDDPAALKFLGEEPQQATTPSYRKRPKTLDGDPPVHTEISTAEYITHCANGDILRRVGWSV